MISQEEFKITQSQTVNPADASGVSGCVVLAEDDPIEPFLTDFAHVDTSLVRPGPASYAPRALAPSRTDLGGI